MDSRYQDPEIAEIWSRSTQLKTWAEVELAWLREHTYDGYEDAVSVPVPTPGEVERAEQHLHHEFVAFLRVWTEQFQNTEAQRWVHYGLTSSDVIDTATAIQLMDTHRRLDDLAHDALRMLAQRATELELIVQVGRTHGQWAQPRRADNPLNVLGLMLGRQVRRLAEAYDDLAEADFSGPTGGRHALDDHKVKVALRWLGLHRAVYSTQILPRDGWVHWAGIVVGLVTISEAIAEHHWLLAQSEVAEVTVANGAPSSAMPHKRANPHLAENVRGLARLARGIGATLQESIVQRGDRDLAHSSVERVALPDLAHLAATALRRTTQILRDYTYDPEQIAENYTRAMLCGANSAARANDLVVAGTSRHDAIQITAKEIP